MSNAAKHRKKAAEFEQLKQIDRAIASYVRAIEESEADGEDVDVALLNKVGDLALRQGRVPDAVTYYERAVEHYATAGLFNNAIALCNKILRNAPGRSNVYFTLGRICARKGLRGDATRNFLEYAARMQQEGRVEEAMRALGEVADLTPELTEVRRLVDEHAMRAGVELPRRRTPMATEAVTAQVAPRFAGEKSPNLVFLEVDYSAASSRLTPPIALHARQPVESPRPLADVPGGATGKAPSIVLPFIDLDAPPGVASNTSRAVPALAPIEVPSPLPVASDTSIDAHSDADDIVDETESTSFVELPMLDLLGSEPDVEDDHATDSVDSVAALPTLDLPMLDLPTNDLPTLEWEIGNDSPPIVTIESIRLGGDELSSIGLEPVLLDHIDFGSDSLAPEPTLDSFMETPIALTVDTPTFSDVVSDTVDVSSIDDASVDLPAIDVSPTEGASIQGDAEIEVAPTSALAVEQVDERDSEHPTPIAMPAMASAPFRLRTPLSASPIPAIEAAIAAGAEVAARAAAERPATRRPPFRLDPHDFILPGELPPLLVDDALVDVGLRRASAAAISLPTPTASVAFVTPVGTPRIVQQVVTPPTTEFVDSVQSVEYEYEREHEHADEAPRDEARDTPLDESSSVAAEIAGEVANQRVDESADGVDTALAAHGGDLVADHAPVDLAADDAPAPDEIALEPFDGLATIDRLRDAVRMTPSLPIGAVAAEANAVAESRRDELRAAVAGSPQDWALRRRLAEALFEAGQRDAALAELEASLQGFVHAGQIADAADISEMLVGVSPERVSYHQKRVELAVRLNDQQRLRFAYLDLADALVRSGEEGRAQAVYVRVLEIDPLDDRARAALGSAAPPPPPPTPTADQEGFVNLAEWLRDDEEPTSTRMRMREPVVSGDEQADFAALLRHFKDGVSRSLGDDDFESRYDLGVAFKEMGLLDDAIGEFQKALRSKTHRLPAYEALGQCFVEQGRYQVAATVLSRALHEPGLNDEQRVGVLYLLAYSCEALQRWGEARSYFQRVYATDINFRDVAARLAALEQVAP